MYGASASQNSVTIGRKKRRQLTVSVSHLSVNDSDLVSLTACTRAMPHTLCGHTDGCHSKTKSRVIGERITVFTYVAGC